ncbi:MAG: HD domain-containing protein [Ruminococcaceae bacterium]|nr:HD domain-containing protein [Oscillospiraceae bacterium]
MKPAQLIEFLGVIEKLKCNTRHSWTSSGRRESVAEHTWRLAVLAMLCKDEYPDMDNDKLIRMCLVHDLGEALTGDVPSFYKTEQNELSEAEAWEQIFLMLPEPYASEIRALYEEMEKRETPEAKLYKALDNMEAVISHNEASLDTWIPLEYTLNLTYGEENAAWSPYTRELRAYLTEQTKQKLEKAEAEHERKQDQNN